MTGPPSTGRLRLHVPPYRTWLGLPIPVQSWGQAASALACTSIGLGLALVAIALLRGLPPLGTAAAMFGCAALGVMPVVATTRPSTLTIRTDPQGEGFWRRRVQDRLEFHGYRDVLPGEDGTTRHRLQLRRWLRWRANEFVVAPAFDGEHAALVVTGPAMINRLLHKALQA